MPAVKLNISLDETVEATMRRRAAQLKKPASRYLADLILEEDRRSRDDLATEGYRLLSREGSDFAEEALRIASENWPQWQDDRSPDEVSGVG